MADYYILNEDHSVKPVEMMEWVQWQAKDRKQCIVQQDKFGEIKVSTVFLGLNHAWLNQGPPLIFETMIFGGPEDGYQERYSTWNDALEGHKRALELSKPPKP